MADKALNSVATDTSFDYFLGVKGTEVKKMTKEQVATVVGELLLGNSRYWFKFRGAVNNQSYNDLTETGYYKIENSVTNGPNVYWGTLVVFNDGEQLTQIFYPNTDISDIMIRKSGKVSDIGKSSWRRISLTII